MRGSWLLLTLVCGTASAHRGTHEEIRRASAELAANPSDATLRLRRAALHRVHGQHAASLADIAAAARLGADPVAVDLQRGQTLAESGRHQEAVEVLARASAARPSWAAHVTRAHSLEQLGRLAEAVGELDRALAIRPHVDAFLDRGRLQRGLGRLDAAAAGYREALVALGPATLVVDALVEVELARGQVAAALALVDARIRRHSTTRWFLRRAEVLATAGDEVGRAASLDTALRVADRAVGKRASAINLVSRARVHLARGAWALAQADLRAALARAPGYRPAQELVARAEARQ